MSRQITILKDKDYKLLKKGGMTLLGENGHLFPTFGNHIEDFVKFCVYDIHDTYLKSGISETYENKDNTIRLKPGNDLRKAGFTRGNYKVKYFFYRRLAGADEVILTKTVGNEFGVVHSGNPKLTGVPMGNFHIDMNGNNTALAIDSTGSTGRALYCYSNQGSGQGDPLVSLTVDKSWVNRFDLVFEAEDEQDAEAQAMVEVKQNLRDYIRAHADEEE